MLTPLVVTVYTLLLPIAPNDFWYNARAGAHIAATGSIPVTALFTTSVPPETPYYYQSWLAQLLLFKALENYGLSGVVILRSVCLLAAFILILFAVWRRVTRINSASPHHLADTSLARITALSVLAAFALSASNMDVRPQTFSVPLFALFLLCLFEWPFLKLKGRIFVSALLAAGMILWANLHGAFFTGIVLVAVYSGGELLGWLLTRNPRKSQGLWDRVTPDSLKLTLVIFPLICLCALLNPRGGQLFTYVFSLAELEANQKYIQEWQAPHWTDWYGALFFFAFAILCLCTFLSMRRSQHSAPASTAPGIRLSELLVIATLAVMAFRDSRSIIWFGLFLAPIFAAQITQLLLDKSRASLPPDDIPRPAQIINAVLALILLAGILPFLPQGRAALPLPPEYATQFAPTPRSAFPAGFPRDSSGLLENTTPVKAVEYLTAHPPTGKIWNDFVFGSYLSWATLYQPRLAPHADPRVEMRPLTFWDEYGKINEGAPGAADYLTKHGFSDALLNTEEQLKLIAQLKAAGWRIMVAPNSKQGEKGVLLRHLPVQESAMAN